MRQSPKAEIPHRRDLSPIRSPPLSHPLSHTSCATALEPFPSASRTFAQAWQQGRLQAPSLQRGIVPRSSQGRRMHLDPPLPLFRAILQFFGGDFEFQIWIWAEKFLSRPPYLKILVSSINTPSKNVERVENFSGRKNLGLEDFKLEFWLKTWVGNLEVETSTGFFGRRISTRRTVRVLEKSFRSFCLFVEGTKREI